MSIDIEPLICSGALIFNCIANGQPPPDITWLWTSNTGSEVELSVGSTVVNTTVFNVLNNISVTVVESVLIVQNIACANYTVTCSASNEVGNISASAYVAVQIKSKT